MKKYFTAAPVRSLYQSFYKPEIYREALLQWPGFGGKYLMVLALVLAFMLASQFWYTLDQFKRHSLPQLIESVPTITIEDGEITDIQGEQPVIIHSEDKSLTLIIDTTKNENELRQMKPHIGVGRDFIFVSDYKGNDRRITLEKMTGKTVINEKELYRLWDRHVPTIQIFAVPLLWVNQIVILLFSCLLITVLSYIVTAFLPEEYPFNARMRLSALAITPPSILIALLQVTIKHESQPWLVFLVATLYIYVMIILMRRLPPLEGIPPEETPEDSAPLA